MAFVPIDISAELVAIALLPIITLLSNSILGLDPEINNDPVIWASPVNGKASPPTPVKLEPSPWNEPEMVGLMI